MGMGKIPTLWEDSSLEMGHGRKHSDMAEIKDREGYMKGIINQAVPNLTKLCQIK
jgi:hypothetical protein